MNEQGKLTYVPRRGVFEATLKCNLRCRHCGSRAGQPRSDELSIAEISDMFRQLGALGMEWITISGGEPTTRDDWPDIIEAATSAGIRAGMITNAVTLDLNAARLAKAKGLSGIGLSLDGGEAATHDRIRGRIGHFNTLLGAMAVCREAEVPFAVITHMNTYNMGQLDAMHDLIVENGAYAWQVQLGTDMGNMSDHRDMLVSPQNLVDIEATLGRLIRRGRLRICPSDSIGYFGPNESYLRNGGRRGHWKGCGAGKTVIGIESNGNIKGCLSIMAGYNERSDEFVEGNLRQESIRDIWCRDGAFAYNRNRSVASLGGVCGSCDKAAVCHGGCTAKKVASGNGEDNPMCVYRVLNENREQGHSRVGQAAAVVLAGVLSGGLGGCDDVTEPTPDSGGGTDTGEAVDTDSASSGEDTGAVGPDYGMPVDTEPAMEYGMPMDTDVDTEPAMDYGMPVDTDVDTEPAIDYGMPVDTDVDTEPAIDYGMPVDTDVDTEPAMDYGMPVDTDR